MLSRYSVARSPHARSTKRHARTARDPQRPLGHTLLQQPSRDSPAAATPQKRAHAVGPFCMP
eukprot:4934068-Prymnesium_polylepis.1